MHIVDDEIAVKTPRKIAKNPFYSFSIYDLNSKYIFIDWKEFAYLAYQFKKNSNGFLGNWLFLLLLVIV